MVRAAARFPPALQVSRHHDRGRGRVLQSIHENGSDSDLRSVFAAHGHTLELKFNESNGELKYRWKADEAAFATPVRVGVADKWQTTRPTTNWQEMKTGLRKAEFEVPTDLYYVNVSKQ
jgi:hypothetical protein